MKKMSVLNSVLLVTMMATAFAAMAATPESRFSLNAVQIEKTPLITSADVQEAGVVAQPGTDGLKVVRITLTPESASKLAAYSKKNVGRELAVLINHHLVAAPVIRVPITGRQFEVSGLSTSEADELLKQIQSSMK